MTDINVQYPYDPDYDYFTTLERVNLDQERIRYLTEGKGFIISEPQPTLKKDLKNPNGIYSTKFGATLQDINPLADRYKCRCGGLKSRLYNGIVCKVCREPVRYVDDNFDFYGWIVLKDPYYIIHPNLYKSISHLLGQNKAKQDILDNILLPLDEKNEDGYDLKLKSNEIEPYIGIGMLKFKDKFEEIMQFYANKSPQKRAYYEDIMKNREKIFIQSIPVFTTQLRPFSVDGVKFHFEGTNGTYNLMVKLAVKINKDNTRMHSSNKKSKKQLLFNLNTKYQVLCKEIENILSGKKGVIRSIIGGRLKIRLLK